MTHEENFGISIREIAAKNPNDAISLLVGALVGLVEFLIEEKGEDNTKQITLNGGENRDVIICASKNGE